VGESAPGKPVTLARAEPGGGALIPVEVPSEARWGSIIAGPRGGLGPLLRNPDESTVIRHAKLAAYRH
jgi:hypothetical protein